MYSHKEGMDSKNQEGQAAQIRAFLEIADENGVDLVITPEASVPRKVIEEIIDGSIRPEEGKLWCLGAEGMNKNIYRSLVQKWEHAGAVSLHGIYSKRH